MGLNLVWLLKKRKEKQRQQVKSTESAKLPTHAPTEHYKIVLTITKHLLIQSS